MPFARELITLDDLSGGRFTLGIGAGGTGWDATTLGQVPWERKERADRFEEFVVLSDLLLRQPVTTYEGRYYSAFEARSAPGCVQGPRLPFAIAAAGPRGMRITVEHGQTWVTIGQGDRAGPAPVEEGVAVVAEQMARLDEACAAGGRDPATLDRLVLTGLTLDSGVGSPDQFADTLGRYEAVGVTDFVVHWPRPTPPYQGDEAAFERALRVPPLIATADPTDITAHVVAGAHDHRSGARRGRPPRESGRDRRVGRPRACGSSGRRGRRGPTGRGRARPG